MNLKFKNSDGEWVKIPATDDFAKLKNVPFTSVSKDDKRFSSFDTLFLKGENDDELKLSVDPGVYCLADDIEFAFSAFILLKDYLKFIYEGQSEDQMEDLVYKSTQCTLPKGSFIYITESFLEIYCTYTDVETYGPGGGSGESFTHCKTYITGTFPAALDDNEHVCGLIEFDSIMKDMEDGTLTYPFEYAMMNTEGFKEGDTLVVTNNSDDSDSLESWSGPKFKIGSAGVQATQITDANYTNYQTMDQWSALNDGMYLVNTDKLSINVVGKNKVYSAGSAGFCALLGIEENYNKSLSIPKGNYISVYTTEAGGSSYYKYKMMVIYQIEANPDAEENNRPSAGEAVVITLGSPYMSNPFMSNPFSKDVKVYDFNESLMLQSTLNNYISLIFTPLSSPDTVPKGGQLAQWEGDAAHGFKLKGVDAPKGSSINVIEEKDRDKYSTLDKLCHLEDGIYQYVGTTPITLTYKSQDMFRQTMGESGTQDGSSTIYDESFKLQNGTLFNVYSNTSTDIPGGKGISILCGIPSDANQSFWSLGGGVYIDAMPDSGKGTSTDPYVYGVTGQGCNTSVVNTIGFYGGLTSLGLFKSTLLGAEDSPESGQYAQFQEDSSSLFGVSIKGVDAPSLATKITDDNYTNYTTTEKLAKLNAGVYYVNTDNLSINLKGIDIKSQISTLFPQTNVDDTINVEKGSQITVTVKQSGSPEAGYQIQKLVNIYNTEGLGYPYSIFFVDAENNPNQALVSMGTDLINTALSYSYSAANQLGEIMNTCITDESLRGKVPVISAPDEQTATGVKNVFKAMDLTDVFGDKIQENESTSVVLNNHTEYRCKVMASLNLSLPETIPDDYNSRIVFESGETATTLSYTAGSIKFTGDDCDSSNALVPAKNTSYEVDIKYLGLDSSGNKRIIARVGAF